MGWICYAIASLMILVTGTSEESIQAAIILFIIGMIFHWRVWVNLPFRILLFVVSFFVGYSTTRKK